MAKNLIITISLLNLLALLSPIANARLIALPTDKIPQPATALEQKLKNLKADDDYTLLTVFVQEFTAGKNRTLWDVAKAEITPNSATSFGLVAVFDNPLTAGVELNSQPVGRVQGTVAYADFTQTAIILNLSFLFTEEGPYKDSTLIVQGRNQIYDMVREMSIVGGTGEFIMARGAAATVTRTMDEATGYNVYQYNLYVFPGLKGPSKA